MFNETLPNPPKKRLTKAEIKAMNDYSDSCCVHFCPKERCIYCSGKYLYGVIVLFCNTCNSNVWHARKSKYSKIGFCLRCEDNGKKTERLLKPKKGDFAIGA